MDRTARSVLGRWGAGEADDVVQDALVAALTTDALPDGDVGAWLRAIAVRKALDHARRRARRREDPLDDGDGPPRFDPPAATPDLNDVVAARELLARLAPADRAVLVLADLEGRSMAEIAATLRSSRVAVKLRASRARRRLARWLRDDAVGAHAAEERS